MLSCGSIAKQVVNRGSRHRLAATIAAGLAVAAILSGCSSSTKGSASPAGSTATPTTSSASSVASVTPAAGTSPSSAAPTGAATGPAGGAAAIPSTCADIPASVLLPYVRAALYNGSTHPTGGVTCEYQSIATRQILILTVGHGSAAVFTELETGTTKQPGITVAPLAGVGAMAFTIGKGGTVTGLTTLTSNNVLIGVTADLAMARLIALANKLVARYG